jgi:hypothetical protein
MKNHKKLSIIILLALIISACGSNPEEFVIRGTHIEGILTVVSRERIEFEGRVSDEPNTSFWLFSQEEGVGEGNPNWVPMNCTVSTSDTTGNAYVSCFVEVDKKYRQNALVLASSEDPQSGRVERIEYRPNLIIGEEEQAQLWDYNYQQLGVEPISVKNAMQIYQMLGLEMEVNADYNRYPPTYQDPLDERYAPSRGYYLTFITKTSCNGVFSENHVNLYRWNGSEWEFADSLRLEDVDFYYESGTHDFNVEGYTVRLTYSHHYKCHRQYEYVEIP